MHNTASLAAHAEIIRRLSRRAIKDAIEIGRRLTVCKKALGHGHWGDWLKREFGWCDRTAERFMSLHDLASKNDNLSNLPLSVSSLFLLAARSTPEIACEEVIARARAQLDGAKRGEPLSVEAVKNTICECKKALKVASSPRVQGARNARDQRAEPLSGSAANFLAYLNYKLDEATRAAG